MYMINIIEVNKKTLLYRAMSRLGRRDFTLYTKIHFEPKAYKRYYVKRSPRDLIRKSYFIEQCSFPHSSMLFVVPPTVGLHIGKALNLNDLEEGDDVYFECSILANPPAYKVTWLHNVSSKSINQSKIYQILQQEFFKSERCSKKNLPFQ